MEFRPNLVGYSVCTKSTILIEFSNVTHPSLYNAKFQGPPNLMPYLAVRSVFINIGALVREKMARKTFSIGITRTLCTVSTHAAACFVKIQSMCSKNLWNYLWDTNKLASTCN